MPLFTIMSGNAGAQLDQSGPAVPRNEQAIESELTGPGKSIGYVPNLPVRSTFLANQTVPPYYMVLYDTESMLAHPTINMFLSYYCSGIWPARFVVRASSSAVEEFVQSQLKRWWQRGLRQVQWAAYGWGWCGGELVYRINKGRLELSDINTFAPPDAILLTSRNQYVGVRVRSSRAMGEKQEEQRINLWGPSDRVPAKSYWFIHKRRYGQWHGWTQLYGAWRPWRRLAWPNGGEEILDGGVYRFAYQGPIGRYPPSSDRGIRRAPGQERQDNRDKMLELTEGVKAGAGIALSSARDQFGNYLWDIDFPKSTLDVKGLLEYDMRLKDDIGMGMEVPPELIRAHPGSGGESGRQVVVQGYYVSQQHNAETQVATIDYHAIRPLVWWNFGPDAWYEIEVLPLLESQQLQSTGMRAMPGAPVQPGGSPDQITSNAARSETPSEPAGAASEGQTSAQGQQGMSLAERDELVEESATAIRAWAKFARKAMKEALNCQSSEWVNAGLDLTRELLPRLADLLGDVRMSAALVGMQEVREAEQAPELAEECLTGWELCNRQFRPGCAVEADHYLRTHSGFDATDLATIERTQRDDGLNEADHAFAALVDRLDLTANRLSTVSDPSKLLDILTIGTVLDPNGAEKIAEKLVTSALSDGMDLAMSKCEQGKYPYVRMAGGGGINGGSIYRSDDPVFRHQRRLGRWKPISLDVAAGAGVSEAQEWKRTGMPPSIPSYVGGHNLALGLPPDRGPHRAPQGGIWINGKFYAAGQFIPRAQIKKASPSEKKELAQKTGSSVDDLKAELDGMEKDRAESPDQTPQAVGTVQIEIDASEFRNSVPRQIYHLISAIQDDDLADKGKEDRPHVTIFYGLEASIGPEQVQAAIGAFGPIDFQFGTTKCFAQKDHDVVYVEVRSPKIEALHQRLLQLPNRQTQPIFKPHMTLAYVKPGRGGDYIGERFVAGQRGLARSVTFIDAADQHTPIALGEGQ